jgi:hypothetical protein
VIPAEYSVPDSSGLTAEIKAGMANEVLLELKSDFKGE